MFLKNGRTCSCKDLIDSWFEHFWHLCTYLYLSPEKYLKNLICRWFIMLCVFHKKNHPLQSFHTLLRVSEFSRSLNSARPETDFPVPNIRIPRLCGVLKYFSPWKTFKLLLQFFFPPSGEHQRLFSKFHFNFYFCQFNLQTTFLALSRPLTFLASFSSTRKRKKRSHLATKSKC